MDGKNGDENSPNNKTVIAVYNLLYNHFQPAVKEVADAGAELVKAFQVMHKASERYISSLEELSVVGVNCEKNAKIQVKKLKQHTELMRFILEENDEFANEFGGIVAKINTYNAVEKNNLKTLIGEYKKREKSYKRIKRLQTEGKEGLEDFYKHELTMAAEQQKHRYKFFVEKHQHWLRHFTDMLQHTQLQWSLIFDAESTSGDTEMSMLLGETYSNGIFDGAKNGSSTYSISLSDVFSNGIQQTNSTVRSDAFTGKSTITESTLKQENMEIPNERVEVISVKQAPRYITPSSEHPRPPEFATTYTEIHEKTPAITARQTNAEERTIGISQTTKILPPRQPQPTIDSEKTPAVAPKQTNADERKTGISLTTKILPPRQPQPTSDNDKTANRGSDATLSADISAAKRHGKLLVCTQAFEAQADNQLSLAVGDKLQLIKTGTKGWVFVRNLSNQRTGWFPSQYVKNEE